MKKVLVFKGLPASGKTTKAKEMINEFPGRYKRVNKDDLRAMLDNSRWSKDNEGFVLSLRNIIIIQALNHGKSVIVDDTNLDPKHLSCIKELVHNHNSMSNDNVVVEEIFFDVPLQVAIDRDSKRGEKSVGPKVISDMYYKYIHEQSEPMKQNENLPKAIIVDIDGTIALSPQRSPFDWSKVGSDIPNKPVIELIQQLLTSNFIETILFTSGRKKQCEKDTINWIIKYIKIPKHIKMKIFMRDDEDNRKDSLVKKDLYDAFIKDRYYIKFVLDDRNQVVDMWRKELGLTCLQVNFGDF